MMIEWDGCVILFYTPCTIHWQSNRRIGGESLSLILTTWFGLRRIEKVIRCAHHIEIAHGTLPPSILSISSVFHSSHSYHSFIPFWNQTNSFKPTIPSFLPISFHHHPSTIHHSFHIFSITINPSSSHSPHHSPISSHSIPTIQIHSSIHHYFESS